MKDGYCEPARIVTLERVLAVVLVLTWIVLAARFGGLALAIRAILLFQVPLVFVWMPELMARIAGVASRKSLQPGVIVSAMAVRLVGWVVILGVPLAWWGFSRMVVPGA